MHGKYRAIGYRFLIFVATIQVGCQSEKELQADRQTVPKQIDFNFHVRPILSDRCYACHGPDENAVKANLRLDNQEHAFAPLKNGDGFAIVKGKPTESELINRILSTHPDHIMPPPESEMKLSETEKAILVKWIEQGAEWKDHWAFIPATAMEIPKNYNKSWGRNEIDYFILKKLHEIGTEPAKDAPKTQWLRRVTFDITGLPPRPEDINDFLDDPSEDAYEKVVDRLLGSVAYGERMATLWLDIARYADSHGYQDDRPRTMWPWRDWVIDAFNDNLPYREFATWQIAGDLLPNANYQQKLATGFNRNHAITQEGGVVEQEYLAEYAADRTQTFSTAFLGITMECARCHTHKYDPFTQEEYYSLLGFFNNIPERGVVNYFDEAPEPKMELKDPLMDSTIVQIKQWIAEKESELDKVQYDEVPAFVEWLTTGNQKEEVQKGLKDGLMTYFKLDEFANGQFYSEIQGQPNGLMNINLPTEIPTPKYVQGKTGKALQFNGANFLSLGEVGDFEWYDAFSFGGWIRYGSSQKKNAGIFARRNGEQKRSGYDLILTKNKQLSARLIHEYRPEYDVNYAIDVITEQRIARNQWYHVLVTYDGSGRAKGLNIYINGERQALQIQTDSLRGKSIQNGNDFLVGNWNHRMRQTRELFGFRDGVIDEVVLYNRALSGLEIRQLIGEDRSPKREEAYAHFLKNQYLPYQGILHQLDSLRKIDLTKPSVMVMKELDTVKATFLLNRGAYDDPIKQVQRGTPKAVLPFSSKYSKNRLGLAEWLFDPQNPLTSRVMVNRFWQIFFGKGLVATPEDFGNQGSLPTHPELLDWLAVYFQDQDWDMKQLVKLIVLSATYRQDATIDQKKYVADKDNQWLSRGPAQRLTAEMLRDQALLASGLYYEKVGGKWVKPYQPKGVWKELANQIGENKYRISEGKNLYRRSLYSYWKRTIPPPTMITFDAPERVVCSVKRQQTSTPLQSLVLLNEPLFVEASRKLAEWVNVEAESTTSRISLAFLRAVSRSPEVKEIELLKDVYEAEYQRFNAQPKEAEALLAIGESTYSKKIDQVELAAMTVVANTILNLDEAKYR